MKDTKFILTKELGRLAKWLRIMGFDASYFKEENKSILIITSLQEERIILTRDSRLSRFSGIRMLRIKSDFVKEQIEQVIADLKLKPNENGMFTRCIVCNELLGDIEKQKIKNKIPEYVYKTQSTFVSCPACKRVYWQGTHWGNVRKFLGEAKCDS